MYDVDGEVPGDDWFRSVAARASTRAERAAGIDVAPVGRSEDAERDRIEARWQRWKTLAAGDDEARFARRLAWDGLDEASARLSIGPVQWRDAVPLPPWIATLRALMARGATVAAEDRACLDPAHPLPFETALLPFVAVARDRVIARDAVAWSAMGAGARATIERRLLATLCHIAAPSLFAEFRARVPDGRTGFDRLLARLQPTPPSSTHYGRFIAALRDGGLAGYFESYPVAARLLARSVDRWADGIVEFLTRLSSDRTEIADTFNRGQNPGSVVAFGDATSDAHHGGRRVLAPVFTSGLRLVYKPRDITIEQRYGALLGWANAAGVTFPFLTLRTVAREGYGWVEHVGHAPCDDADGVRRYYHRAGALTALAYTTGGSDFHFENLVASGDQPVLVDLEALLQPLPAVSAGQAAIADSGVLTSGLLPFWIVTPDDEAFDASALGGVFDQTMAAVSTWEAVNTDAMARATTPAPLGRARNRVLLAERVQSPAAHAGAIVAGFLEVSNLVRRHRTVLVAANGPLAALRHERPRFVFRPTSLYGRVARSAVEPACLRDGADRSVALDVLSRPLLGTAERPRTWPLRGSEQAAMEDLDVPHFTAAADGTAVEVAGRVVVDEALAVSAYDRLITRVHSLDDDVVRRQVALIHASLEGHGPPDARSSSGPDPHASTTEFRLTPAQLIDASVRIGRDILARALHLPGGRVNWIGVSFTPDVERYYLRELDDDVYNGTAGIALFLGALYRETGDGEFRDVALAALRRLRDAAEGPLPASLGAGWGAGSAIYALVRAATLLDVPAFVDGARRAAQDVTAERIAADTTFDVVGGAAGAIAALLNLHDVTRDPAVLQRATACGRHLLDNRVATSVGLSAWSARGAEPLTGFSHGAAGIAYALLRLYAVTRDEAFAAAAAEGFAYERRHFSAADGNWGDLRPDRRRGFRTAWCHGAAGIGLSRVGALATLDTPDMRRDIEVAMATTIAAGLEGVEQLCCGSAGRADILIEAGARLSRSDWHDAGVRLLSQLVSRRQAGGRWHLLPGLPAGVYNPVLFRGTAGIGYALLRAARPGTLPSVLLFDA